MFKSLGSLRKLWLKVVSPKTKSSHFSNFLLTYVHYISTCLRGLRKHFLGYLINGKSEHIGIREEFTE